MLITGELVKDNVIIQKPRDVGRLFNKSHFGTTLSGNKLRLNLLEGVFLIDEGKIRILQSKRIVSFQDLFIKAAKKIPCFENKYLVFRDLKKRGYAVKLNDDPDDFAFQVMQKDKDFCFFVSVFSEQDYLSISKTREMINYCNRNKKGLWFAIVDEEGDITYYDVSYIDLKGNIDNHKFSKDFGVLLNNSVVVFDKKLAASLHDKEFFGKTFGEGIHLSMVESLYLMEKKIINIKDIEDNIFSFDDFKKFVSESQPDIDQRLKVFKDLKKKGVIVKTGFKFGAHFRVYTDKPDKTHAEYLVHVVSKDYVSVWAETSRAVRLAHSVNKEIVFACADDDSIIYVKLGRLRP